MLENEFQTVIVRAVLDREIHILRGEIVIVPHADSGGTDLVALHRHLLRGVIGEGHGIVGIGAAAGDRARLHGHVLDLIHLQRIEVAVLEHGALRVLHGFHRLTEGQLRGHDGAQGVEMPAVAVGLFRKQAAAAVDHELEGHVLLILIERGQHGAQAQHQHAGDRKLLRGAQIYDLVAFFLRQLVNERAAFGVAALVNGHEALVGMLLPHLLQAVVFDQIVVEDRLAPA